MTQRNREPADEGGCVVEVEEDLGHPLPRPDQQTVDGVAAARRRPTLRNGGLNELHQPGEVFTLPAQRRPVEPGGVQHGEGAGGVDPAQVGDVDALGAAAAKRPIQPVGGPAHADRRPVAAQDKRLATSQELEVRRLHDPL